MSIRSLFMIAVAVFAVLSLFSVGAAAQNTQTKVNSKLAKQAKITIEQARQTALDTVTGNVEEEELEKEHGKLVYSFDIRNSRGTISEVQVDAKTGSVVSNQEETKENEEREKQEDAKRARSKKPNGKN